MKLEFWVAILALLFTSVSYANPDRGEGGHTGNGGGTIVCPGQALVMLDFEEIPKPRDVLDLEHLDRDAFIDLIVSRVRLASAQGTLDLLRPWWKDAPHSPSSLAPEALRRILIRNGPVDEWPTTEAWRVRDEATAAEALPRCPFEQAAISRDGFPNRIRSVTDRMSEGQKRILELHEAIFYFADRNARHALNGTSAIVRSLVRALIRKGPSAADLQKALLTFALPYPNPPEWYRHSGLYRLKRVSSEAKASACPMWVGVVPNGSTTTGIAQAYVYLFDDEPRPRIEEYSVVPQQLTLPARILSVSRHCSYTRMGWIGWSAGDLESKSLTSEREAIFSLKRMIEVYESHHLGIPSRYDEVVRRLIKGR